MHFRRSLLHRKTVESDSGGILNDGPFIVKLGNFKLIYRERGHRFQIPVELLQGKDVDCNIGTSLIRQWGDPLETLNKEQVAAVSANIFAALDYMHIRYSNVR
jgi:hypothetical protein